VKNPLAYPELLMTNPQLKYWALFIEDGVTSKACHFTKSCEISGEFLKIPKGGIIIVPLTSCLTGLESAV